MTYVAVSDAEALDAFESLSRAEGIVPALESAHAVAYRLEARVEDAHAAAILVNLSGRGDKDLEEYARLRGSPA